MKKILGLIVLLAIIASALLVFKPYPLINVLNTYKTQTILYRYKSNPEITIQFQMKDLGGLGYSKRTVMVKPKLLWDRASDIKISDIDLSEWQEVNETINELGLKYP